MHKVDKDVAAMLANLNKLDRANKARLVENTIIHRGTRYGGSPGYPEYPGDDIKDPSDEELLAFQNSGIPDRDRGAAEQYGVNLDDEGEYTFKLSEGEGVDASILHDIVSRYERGEISYQELKQEFELAEQDCCEADTQETEFSLDAAYPDEDEFLEAVRKKDIPAYQRKASGDKDWRVTQKDLKDDEDEYLSGEVKSKERLKNPKPVHERADADVLDWMKRFSRLG